MNFNFEHRIRTSPKADDKIVIKGDNYRFTVLDSRLIRIEYNENGIFEDRATQTVINRSFSPVSFSCEDKEDLLIIATDDIILKYTKKPFSPNSLSLRYTGKSSNVNAGKFSSSWYFGESSDSLGGTARTLDDINGECELGPSIMSRGSVCVLDDSRSLILEENGQIIPRTEKCIDMYLFCYGTSGKLRYDYLGALRAFYSLTGKTPLLPRFVFGNWWSRFHAYTQEEYETLIKRFKKENIPFSTAVIDMDWHLTKIDSKYGTGWTGYTWNKDLFPDHRAFLDFLHNEGLEVTLNLHPQEGVSAHEDAYKEMALAMDIDPKTEKNIEFDITNEKFLQNYFSILHHPMEKEGVTFWWIDWQQGNTTSVPGLDPLWMLNHYHYLDNGRSGNRALTFSRYAGPGSHRYPIGFSGDTHITWESLDFQPFFTASASNIGYGWWSHDIGGHMHGKRDEELTARWIQLGTFSPINRLHSTSSLFLGKEPWKYNKITEASMKKFLKLRHELIPYLYSMNYRAHRFDEPLVRPLYYHYGEKEAFMYKNEFLFGTEMLAAPITRPHDIYTTLGSVELYLPHGKWYDFFTNMRYTGGRKMTAFRDLYEMPVFVKSGGIVPLADKLNDNSIKNPKNLRIKVYAGESGQFDLYEDDGVSMEYENGKYSVTEMRLDWSDNPSFKINISGDKSYIPKKRNYSIEFIGIGRCLDIEVTDGFSPVEYSCDWLDGILYVNIEKHDGNFEIKIKDTVREEPNNLSKPLIKIIEHSEIDNNIKDEIFYKMNGDLSTAKKLAELLNYDIPETFRNALSEIVASDRI